MNKKTIDVNFTPEQISLHIGALVSHKKRHERSLYHDDTRIHDAMAAGDVEYVAKMKASKRRREELIATIDDELEYFNGLAEDIGNDGKGEN